MHTYIRTCIHIHNGSSNYSNDSNNNHNIEINIVNYYSSRRLRTRRS